MDEYRKQYVSPSFFGCLGPGLANVQYENRGMQDAGSYVWNVLVSRNQRHGLQYARVWLARLLHLICYRVGRSFHV